MNEYDSLAKSIKTNLPPDKVSEKNATRHKKLISEEIIVVADQYAKFCETNKLGVFKKARLLKALAEQLTNSGYEDQFIKALNEKILFRQLER